jgi:hypothetical protein
MAIGGKEEYAKAVKAEEKKVKAEEKKVKAEEKKMTAEERKVKAEKKKVEVEQRKATAAEKKVKAEESKAKADAKGSKRKREPAAEVEEPTRKSGRARPAVSYADPGDFSESEMKQLDKKSTDPVGGSKPGPDYDPSAPVSHLEPSYDATEGERDSEGRLVLPGSKVFRPSLTPRQMLQAGMVGGCYFNPKGGKPSMKFPRDKYPDGIPGVTTTEFPQEWFKGLDAKMYKSRRYNIPTNKYKVKAGTDQMAWESSGWINAQDPRGWIQWYFRYFTGRRTADDARQIGRWDRSVGEKGRWKSALCKQVVTKNKRFDDASVSPVIRQTHLHWAYELTEHDLEKYRRTH